MRILLDTCTFLWLINEPSRLSSEASAQITNPQNEVFLSVVSGWEIAVKNALGRLPLPSPVEEFVPEMRRRHLLDLLPLQEAAALRVGRLEALHKDPFDRMLVSQALVHQLTLATPDDLVRQYSVPTFW